MEYRVWNIINVPGPAIHIPVKTVKEGIILIQKMATDQRNREGIESNAFGIEVFKDGEWEEWEDEDGYCERYYEALSDDLVLRDDGMRME